MCIRGYTKVNELCIWGLLPLKRQSVKTKNIRDNVFIQRDVFLNRSIKKFKFFEKLPIIF